MGKFINSIKSINRARSLKNRDRLWNRLTKDEQLDLMLQKINGTL